MRAGCRDHIDRCAEMRHCLAELLTQWMNFSVNVDGLCGHDVSPA
jgi:hypothetical protein